MPSEVEIGVWVNGAQKWVTGVSRRTSCHDIIKALLRSQSLPATDSDVNEYVLVERWRKVERPLDHEQRILKVWKTWGEAIQEVRFTLRRIRDDDSDSETGSRVERSRRRHKWKQSSTLASRGHGTQGVSHGSASKKIIDEDAKLNETMERLMRLVVAQGETIQTQLRRMQERDQQIENFEHQLHLFRVQNLGSDYLLQSYLKDPSAESHSHQHMETPPFSKEEEKSNDSGVVTEELGDIDGQPSQSEKSKLGIHHSEDLEDVRNRTILLDKLDKVLVRLLEHEEALGRLENCLTESAACELAQLEEEIANAAAVHAQTVACARQNEQKLRELDMVLYQRRMTLESLMEEDAKYEQEALALQAHLDYIIHLPPTAFQLPEITLKEDYLEADLSKDIIGNLFISSSKLAVPVPSVPHTTKFVTINTVPTNSQKANEVKPSEFSSTAIPKSCLKDNTSVSKPSVNNATKDKPPPLPSTSPPPLEDEDDKDSAKTGSLCVSSRSSSSSDSSRVGTSSCSIKVSKTIPKSVPENAKDVDSTDSNSDTGLSSLHSSSDEGAYVFDTLV